MKLLTISALTLTVCLGMTAAQADERDEQRATRFRTDCRFYGDEHRDNNHRGPKFCYASATYEVKYDKVEGIKFGVGCDRQTIYNDRGITAPQERVSDGIRP